MQITNPWKPIAEPGDNYAMRDGSVVQVQRMVGTLPNLSVEFVVNRYAQYGDDAVEATLKLRDMDYRQFSSWVRNEEPGRR